MNLCVCVCVHVRVCACVCVRACTYSHLRGPMEESQTGSSTVYQHSFMLLVLSQPSRDATLLDMSFVCVALSNVDIMSLQMKLFNFLTRLAKSFCLKCLV